MWLWAHCNESVLALKSISPRKGSFQFLPTTCPVSSLSNAGSKDHLHSWLHTKPIDPTTHETVALASAETHPVATSIRPDLALDGDDSTSSSTISSREPSPSSSVNTATSLSTLSPFIPSLLMQTAHRFRSENSSPSVPFSILCSQSDSYRNWLMLQQIVRQDSDDDDENEETPLDLSMKIDLDPMITPSKRQPSSKPVLAPLHEQDMLKDHLISTSELVQTIKDILIRYSISQRHFGEKVLGLSQGSVSDILARPKSWELLTQKGREPFIRMFLFLNDPNAIKQLVQTSSTASTSLPTESTYHTNPSRPVDEPGPETLIPPSPIITPKTKSKSRSTRLQPVHKSTTPAYDLPRAIPPSNSSC